MTVADSYIAGLSGPDRAAVLLMLLGEQGAAEVLRHMSPREIQRICEAMAKMDNVSRDIVTTILAEFFETVKDQSEIGVGKEEYLCSILNTALGEDKARKVIDRILLGRDLKGLEALKWMEPRTIADMIRLEHPQIIAILLSCLEQDQAAEVLTALPESMRADVIIRIASIDGIQPSAVQELNEILKKQITSDPDNTTALSIGGLKAAAGIMRYLDSAVETEIIGKIGESDRSLSTAIQDLMFVFENLIDVDDRGIQALLREISSETLILAISGADTTIREKIFKNMSRRAAEILRDDMAARGPVKISEIETAKKEILTVARGLAEFGVISLKGRGSDIK